MQLLPNCDDDGIPRRRRISYPFPFPSNAPRRRVHRTRVAPSRLIAECYHHAVFTLASLHRGRCPMSSRYASSNPRARHGHARIQHCTHASLSDPAHSFRRKYPSLYDKPCKRELPPKVASPASCPACECPRIPALRSAPIDRLPDVDIVPNNPNDVLSIAFAEAPARRCGLAGRIILPRRPHLEPAESPTPALYAVTLGVDLVSIRDAKA